MLTRTLAIALTDELPTRQAAGIPGRVAGSSEQPERAWEFGKANLPALLERELHALHPRRPSLSRPPTSFANP